MSNLSFFIVLAALLLFPGPTPAAETEPIAALCARPGLQALREAQEEMTVRDTAAATGIKESTLRQLLKGLPKEGEIRCGGVGLEEPSANASRVETLLRTDTSAGVWNTPAPISSRAESQISE